MIIDLHCDTIERAKDENLKLNDTRLSFNTKEAMKNLPYIQCLATFVHSKYDKGNEGIIRANEIIDNFYKIYNTEEIYIIKNKEDISSPELNKKIGVMLTIENGTAISGNLNNIKKLYNKGIRMMGVVWNDNNDLACGANTQNDIGLTNLGKLYVKELEKQKIIIDVSHMSKKSFYDTMENTTSPIIASHSCAYKLCNHPRNLEDDQIKYIARRNGVIGVCFCKAFLTDKDKATSEDIVNHIDYIANLVGVDYVALGSDFDGLEEHNIPENVRGVKDFKIIINQLKDKGYSSQDVEKICSKNFLRVLKKVL